MNKSFAAAGSVIALALVPAISHAVPELDVKVGAGAEYHDNALQTESDERSDYARVVNAGVIFRNPDRNLPINIDYVVENRDFEHDLQDDETTLTGSSSLMWAALPRTLEFNLSNQSSSQVVNRQGSNVSNNREQRTITSVGANLYGHLGAVDTLYLSPGFTDVQITGDTGDDSERASLGAGWEHRLSQVSAFTLNVSRSKVDSENALNDYDLDVASLGLTTRLSRLTYSLEVGGNRIERDDQDDVSGTLAQLGVEYVGGDASWGLSYVNRLTDSSLGLEGFARGTDSVTEFQGGDGNVGEFDVVRSSEADLHATYRFSGATSVQGRLGYLDYDYEETPRDERDYTLDLRYFYIVNTRWQLDIGASYRDADFSEDPTGLEQKETNIDIAATYHFTPKFDARLTIGREERDAKVDDETIQNSQEGEGDYVDGYAILTLNYLIY